MVIKSEFMMNSEIPIILNTLSVKYNEFNKIIEVSTLNIGSQTFHSRVFI